MNATFRSLRTRNYRLFFTGQTVSQSGTWMQQVGQAWLVLELSGSGTLLGVTLALQSLPMLLAGPWGGLLADRLDKRRLLLWTQSLSGGLALLLGVLTATGLVRLWMVLALALALGVVKALDSPARQSFVLEMVGPDQVVNAVALNSIVTHAARVVGPAIAGALIAIVGIASSFVVNAASYFAVVVALALMRPDELHTAPGARRGRGQLREGLRYVRHTPELCAPLLLMTAAGMLAFEFQVTLPLLARTTFGGDAQTYGLLLSAMGAGAVLGGLLIAGSLQPSTTALTVSASVFGGLILVVAVAPSLPLALLALLVLGVATVAFRATANSLLQLRSEPQMRGRVMALWGVAVMGTTPIGGPLMGWVAETAGPRFALAIGGAATILGASTMYWYLRRRTPGHAGPVSGVEGASAVGDAEARPVQAPAVGPTVPGSP